MDAPTKDAPAEAMLEAARRVLNLNGVQGVTFDRVAAEADVERSDIERCFGTRGALLNELAARVLTDLSELGVRTVAEAHSGDEALDAMFRTFVAESVAHIEEFRLTQLAVQLSPEMREAQTPETVEQRHKAGRHVFGALAARLAADLGDAALPNGVQPRQLAFVAAIVATGFVTVRGVQNVMGGGFIHDEQELVDLTSRVLSSPPRTMRQLAALNASSRELASMRSEKELLARVPELMTGTLDFDRALLLMDVDGELMPVASAWPNEEERERAFELIRRWPVPPPHYRRAVETDATIHLPKPLDDPDWPAVPSHEDAETLRALAWNSPMVITPVRCEGVPVGVIAGSAHLRARPLDVEDISRVETFAAMVGIALENVRMLENLNAMVEERTRELGEAQLALVQSEKMASMGRLVAGVAHELNTPVGVVGSAQGSLKKAAERLGGLLDEGRDRRIDAMLKVITDSAHLVGGATERIDAIVTQLRSFARLDEAERKQIDVHVCIEDAISVVRHSLPRNVVIARRFGEIPPMRCYPRRLNELFSSLLWNAADAVEHEGEIVVTTRATPEGVEVEVADTGSGIAEEHLDKIFDPGFTTKGVGVGTGLGLSIAYRIVEQHGGTIVFQSTVGEGTRVLVRLPS